MTRSAPARSFSSAGAPRWRGARVRRIVLAGGVGLATVTALSGCASDVSADELEDTIIAQYAEINTPVDSVDCPEDLPAEVGATLICQISFVGPTPGGYDYDRIRVEVDETDSNSVYYSLVLIAVGQPDDSPADGQPVDPDSPDVSPEIDDQTDGPTENGTNG